VCSRSTEDKLKLSTLSTAGLLTLKTLAAIVSAVSIAFKMFENLTKKDMAVISLFLSDEEKIKDRRCKTRKMMEAHQRPLH
jgi:hypothetical protein